MNRGSFADLKKLNNDELVILRANIETELNKRGISFKVGEVGSSCFEGQNMDIAGAASYEVLSNLALR